MDIRSTSRVDDMTFESRRKRRNRPDLSPIVGVLLLFGVLIGILFLAVYWKPVYAWFNDLEWPSTIAVFMFLLIYLLATIASLLKSINDKMR